MAREKKPIELRTVDDQPTVRVAVLRLGTEAQPVRLIPENKDTRQRPAARLEVPSVDAADNRRSRQPGIEVLMEPEEASVPGTEEGWSQDASRRGPLPWGWFALVALLLAAAVTWSLGHVRQAAPLLSEEHKQAEVVVKESAASDLALQHMIDGIEHQVKAFCQAGSLEAMLPLVRNPKRVGPLMRQFYAQSPLQALGFRRVKDIQGAMLGGASDFWVVSVELGDGRIRDVLLEQDPSGKIGVDWETVVTYQPMNWDDYARQRPPGTAMNFRVYVEEDHFFSHEFVDSNHWASFRLTAPGGEETLFGYAPRGGPLEAELLALIEQNGRNPAPAILRLALPAGTQSRRGVIIDKLMSTRWIYVDPPDSGP